MLIDFPGRIQREVFSIMPRLARRVYHQVLEEVSAWLEQIQSPSSPEPRELLIFGREVLPRFTELLPELVQTLNEYSAEVSAGERSLRGCELPRSGRRWSGSQSRYEMISARVRRRHDSEDRERQCIGPVIGVRGSCIGKGAATDGWQPEVPENFSRKRNQFQARCKACDALRTQGRQLEVTRRGAAARHWLELASAVEGSTENSVLLEEVRKLSLGFLEELRDDWWSALNHSAQRLLELRGDPEKEAWLAVDVDRKLIFSGASPHEACARADGESKDDRLYVLFQQPPRRSGEP